LQFCFFPKTIFSWFLKTSSYVTGDAGKLGIASKKDIEFAGWQVNQIKF